jgi:hypothetical protein
MENIMNRSVYLVIVIFILVLANCSKDNEDPKIAWDNAKNGNIDPLQLFLNKNETNIHELAAYSPNPDIELLSRILVEYSQNGKGFGMLMDYCFDLKPGDIKPDQAVMIINSLLDGAWSKEYTENIEKGRNLNSVSRMININYHAAKEEDPELAERFLKNFFDQTETIEQPVFRAMAIITMATDLYLFGFDGMDEKVQDAVKMFLEERQNTDFKISEGTILSLVADIAVVDPKSASEIAMKSFDDEFLKVEAKSAISAGQMKTSYSEGLSNYKEALKEIHDYPIPRISINNTTFEYAFSQLKDEDKMKLMPEYLDALLIYNRIGLLPPSKRPFQYLTEPQVPSWYRDGLYKWFKNRQSLEERLTMLQTALVDHSGKFPRSSNTEIYVGWVLDWISELEDPYERYASLGNLMSIPNALIPNNAAIAKPRIEQIIKSFEGKLPELSERDTFLEIALFRNPGQFKKLIKSGYDPPTDKDSIFMMTKLFQIRHYFYPTIDADLEDFLSNFIEKSKLPDDLSESDFYSMLASAWAGYDDDKAWMMVEYLDETDGEYPQRLISIASETKNYAPEFAARCFEDLKSRYIKWEYKLSSPAFENSLVKDLCGLSTQWVEEFIDIIVQHRGNYPPDFAFYTLTGQILKNKVNYNIRQSEVEKASAEITARLRSDYELLKEGKLEYPQIPEETQETGSSEESGGSAGGS